jgi:hypothetical protein
MKRFLSCREFAAEYGVQESTAQRWCLNTVLPQDQKQNLPPVVCRKVGKSWFIDAAATETLHVAKFGNSLTKANAK